MTFGAVPTKRKRPGTISPSLTGGSARGVGDRDIRKFLRSGVDARQLARNPSRFLNVAKAVQNDIDTILSRQSFVPRNLKNAEIRTFLGVGSLLGESFLFDFNREQQSLRRSFVDTEIERRFGPQNITSRTSTVTQSGARRPVPGQGAISPVTAAQRAEIESSFKTPLQISVFGGENPVTPPSDAVVKPRTPTIVSGAGIRRRRLRGTTRKGTILTSDADSLVGSQTILG